MPTVPSCRLSSTLSTANPYSESTAMFIQVAKTIGTIVSERGSVKNAAKEQRSRIRI
jgi:hypothetical protein